jgi:two-component system, cell cycle sensor histidine kinase and response regulator CckA
MIAPDGRTAPLRWKRSIRSLASTCTHAVQFYSSSGERELIANVAGFFEEGLGRGERILCISTGAHFDSFVRQLRARNVPVDEAIASECLIYVDAVSALAAFMAGGTADGTLFKQTIAPLIDRITPPDSTLAGRAYGEMVGILWETGDKANALRVEQLWNELLAAVQVSLLCGYPLDVFADEFDSAGISSILDEHEGGVAGARGKFRNAVERVAHEIPGVVNLNPRLPDAADLHGDGAALFALCNAAEEHKTEVLSFAREYYRTERRFQALVENCAESICTLDEKGVVTYASASTQKLLGHAGRTLAGTNFFDLVHAEDLRSLERIWEKALGLMACPVPIEIALQRADGAILRAEGSITNLLEDRDIGALVLNFRDVSEKKAAREALAASERRLAQRERYLATLLDSMPECVKVLDRNGTVLEMNRAGLAMVQADRPDEVIGKCVYPLVDEACREAFRSMNEGVFNGGEGGTLEFSITGLKGARCTFETQVAPLRDEQNRVIGAISATRDITERKQIEEKIRQTAKLESLGVLAGGIAHDFNNLLTGILGAASLLSEEIRPSSFLYPKVETIHAAAQRASQLTRQMLAYSGRGDFVVRTVNLADQVRQILTLLEASIPKHVQLAVQIENANCLIDADEGQLQQIVMNLVINAAEATPAEGVVIVSIRVTRLDQPRTTLVSDLNPGDYVVLEVRDRGIGMDEETRRRIFDPFFTTKFTGRGLGLAAVLGILRGHKGGIEVESAPNRGSCFRVYFPVAGRERRPSDAATRKVAAARRSGRVLLVDDEDVVLRTGKLMLQKLGFEVLAASSGHEAIEQFRRGAGEIVLVLLDMTMPGLSGKDTLEQLKAIAPSIPILGSSGYSPDEARKRFGKGIAAFLPKPYTLKQFSEVVLTVADAR